MTSLIELLLKNWYVLVILYVAGSAVLRRFRTSTRGGDAGQGPRPAPRGGMPPFGGGGIPGAPSGPRRTAEPAPRGEPRGATRGPDRGPSAPVRPPGAAEAGGADAARLAQPARGTSPGQAPPASAAAARAAGSRAGSPASPASSAARPEAARLSPRDAARGVLWAEILGPPRAKRPYGRDSR